MAEDPFAHLHDEAYAAPFAGKRATWQTLVHMGGRRPRSLSGPWHVTPDLFDEGLRQRWFADAPQPIDRWTVPRDADLWTSETMAVPGCWTSAPGRPDLRFFEGAMWYARSFDWRGDAARPRLVLRVGAAASNALVFLNGQFVASHQGASTPFCVELTKAARAGENRLLIQVDNRRRPDGVPMHHFDWFNHGGLHRDVVLLELPPVYIRRFALSLAAEGIAVELTLSDPASGPAEIALPALGLRATLPVEAGTGRTVLPAAPELWSPETPHLTAATARFGLDEVADCVGFRRLATRGGDIVLNGEPITLRGVCVHEDDRELGRVATLADMRRQAADAKSLGCNALRLAHYPHHESMAEIADEAGLLLWSEIPVYWAIDFTNPDTYADAENQLRELIERDRNRASVALWGVGNENADTDARYSFMSRLAEAARRADPTRLVAAACLINREHFRVEDRLAAHLDVVGVNEYFGWYEPGFEGLEQLLANTARGRPLVISETGADALSGLHGSETTLFTEEHQAAVYRGQIETVSRHRDLVKGFFPWILYDFRSERRQTPVQRGWNRKGLIADDKTTRKLAFSVLAEWYAST